MSPGRSSTVCLRYAQPGSCICTTNPAMAREFCPQHHVDTFSKGPKKLGNAKQEGEPRRLKRVFETADDVNDSDYKPSRKSNKKKGSATKKKLKSLSKTPENSSQNEIDRKATCPKQQKPLTPPTRTSPRNNCEAAGFNFSYEQFKTSFAEMSVEIQHTLAEGNSLDKYLHLIPDSWRAPLTQIDFLAADLEIRKIIYRHLLVPSSKAIIFPSQHSRHSFRMVNPELQISILYANSQTYREARAVLYCENKFVAERPSDWFFPVGLQRLRPSTSRLVKHLALEGRGSSGDFCYETTDSLYTPLCQMMIDCPAFLSLKKLTIRREIIRPVNFSLAHFQTYMAYLGVVMDGRPLYKKDELIWKLAAKVAYKAAKRRAKFQGLVIVEDDEHDLYNLEGTVEYVASVYEACLVRIKDTDFDNRDVDMVRSRQNLDKAMLQLLWEEREAGKPGAYKAFDIERDRQYRAGT